MLSVRPKVTELVFQLYGRALHPELFETCHSQTIAMGPYQTKLEITGAGHVISWRYAGMTLTEVAAAANHPLPEKRRLMRYPIRGARSDAVECRGLVRYETTFSLETVPPEVFWQHQLELTGDGLESGLLHRFESRGRIGMEALSLIVADPRGDKLFVRAFHTFPEECAIVKTQSVFQVR